MLSFSLKKKHPSGDCTPANLVTNRNNNYLISPLFIDSDRETLNLRS